MHASWAPKPLLLEFATLGSAPTGEPAKPEDMSAKPFVFAGRAGDERPESEDSGASLFAGAKARPSGD